MSNLIYGISLPIMTLFQTGFLIGIFATLAAQLTLAYLILKYLNVKKPVAQRLTGEITAKPTQEAAAVDFLNLGRTGSNELSNNFMNLIIHRLFLTYQKSAMFRRYYGEKLTKKFNSKLTGNSYISSLAILDVELGDRPAVISAMQTKVMDDLTMVSLTYTR